VQTVINYTNQLWYT